MAVISTRAVLLRSFAYGESSRILRFFTEELGVLGVMARGARKRDSRGGSGLETFAGGVLTVYVKETRDLQTFKDFTPTAPRRGLAADVKRFVGASVLGELVLRHGGEAAHPGLYDALERALDDVADAEPGRLVPVVLARGWGLVSTLGYHPALDPCVACGEPLGVDEIGRFDFAAGGVRCAACAPAVAGPRVGPGARRQLAGLLAGRTDPVTRPRAHLQLLSDFVTYHLAGSRPLESFRIFAGFLPGESADDGEIPESRGES